MAASPPPTPEPTAAQQAEQALWDVRKANLVLQGRETELLYLRHRTLARLAGEPAAEAGGRYRRFRFHTYARVSEFSAQYNAATGEPIAWFFAARMETPNAALQPDQAKRIAEDAAAPPHDAVLAKAEYEEQGGVPAFVARWKHVHQGLPVEGDVIQALVNGRTGKVISVYRLWHDVNTSATMR